MRDAHETADLPPLPPPPPRMRVDQALGESHMQAVLLFTVKYKAVTRACMLLPSTHPPSSPGRGGTLT
jgi:hypothetical protein